MTPRCFIEPDQWGVDLIRLSAGDSRHLASVLRCSPGDFLVVCDGRGGEALCRITGSEGGLLTAEVVERRRQPADMVMVTLVQAIPKSQKMEWIIQKATEIGVWSIIPVMTERGVVRLDGERAGHRVERWQRIAEEAAKQCRTAWIPRVTPIVSLKRLLDSGSKETSTGDQVPALKTEVTLVGSLEQTAIPLKRYLRSLEGKPPASVSLLIGPEGDFSPSELDLAKAMGAVSVSYGSRVLRVETAALYGLSIIAYEFPSR
jgi:16S rRNA (uracil1498-N3)-methyltransferase